MPSACCPHPAPRAQHGTQAAAALLSSPDPPPPPPPPPPLQDFTVFGGSLSESHAAKICRLMDRAVAVRGLGWGPGCGRSRLFQEAARQLPLPLPLPLPAGLPLPAARSSPPRHRRLRLPHPPCAPPGGRADRGAERQRRRAHTGGRDEPGRLRRRLPPQRGRLGCAPAGGGGACGRVRCMAACRRARPRGAAPMTARRAVHAAKRRARPAPARPLLRAQAWCRSSA